MATGITTNTQIAYAIVGNIPRDYHSSDLRNYFSQFIESGGFECFHFRHRPEGKREETGVSKQDAVADVLGDENVNKTKSSDLKRKTFCCVVKLLENNLGKFMKMYHRKHWLDRKGESIAMICLIAKIKIVSSDSNSFASAYKTRGEQRHKQHSEETFTQEDLIKLIELHPPHIMPKGNVGTPTKTFLQFIQECLLPPVVIKKLGLTFPKTRSNKRYGNVPFDYGGEKFEGIPEEDSIVVSGGGHNLEKESAAATDQDAAATDHTSQNGGTCNSNQHVGVSKSSKQKSQESAQKNDIEPEDEKTESEGDNDSCEEWERHEAMYDDPSNQERNKERLFEEEIELKWEKGGSGLVFYTDAQYWDEKEGDFDERTTDDLDVDMSVYYEDNAGDKDSRDYITMRQEQRRRDGMEDTDMFSAGIGKFEKFTKGIGRKVLASQGWRDGDGLGSSSRRGIAEALGSDGQKPKDKSGFGYRGEKLQRYYHTRKNRHQDKDAIITTIYDNPEETDPPEKLLRRNEPYDIKYRSGIRFHKSETINPQ